MKPRYLIIEAPTPAELVSRVNKVISKDIRPVGGVSATVEFIPSYGGQVQTLFLQAMEDTTAGE